jgi:hypothetical protein
MKITGGSNLVPLSLLMLGPLPVIRALSFSLGTDRLLNGRHLAGCDQANAPLGDPIAFFTALQIVSLEKGFWRKSNIRDFSALVGTELAS